MAVPQKYFYIRTLDKFQVLAYNAETGKFTLERRNGSVGQLWSFVRSRKRILRHVASGLLLDINQNREVVAVNESSLMWRLENTQLVSWDHEYIMKVDEKHPSVISVVSSDQIDDISPKYQLELRYLLPKLFLLKCVMFNDSPSGEPRPGIEVVDMYIGTTEESDEGHVEQAEIQTEEPAESEREVIETSNSEILSEGPTTNQASVLYLCVNENNQIVRSESKYVENNLWFRDEQGRICNMNKETYVKAGANNDLVLDSEGTPFDWYPDGTICIRGKAEGLCFTNTGTLELGSNLSTFELEFIQPSASEKQETTTELKEPYPSSEADTNPEHLNENEDSLPTNPLDESMTTTIDDDNIQNVPNPSSEPSNEEQVNPEDSIEENKNESLQDQNELADAQNDKDEENDRVLNDVEVANTDINAIASEVSNDASIPPSANQILENTENIDAENNVSETTNQDLNAQNDDSIENIAPNIENTEVHGEETVAENSVTEEIIKANAENTTAESNVDAVNSTYIENSESQSVVESGEVDIPSHTIEDRKEDSEIPNTETVESLSTNEVPNTIDIKKLVESEENEKIDTSKMENAEPVTSAPEVEN